MQERPLWRDVYCIGKQFLGDHRIYSHLAPNTPVWLYYRKGKAYFFNKEKEAIGFWWFRYDPKHCQAAEFLRSCPGLVWPTHGSKHCIFSIIITGRDERDRSDLEPIKWFEAPCFAMLWHLSNQVMYLLKLCVALSTRAMASRQRIRSCYIYIYRIEVGLPWMDFDNSSTWTWTYILYK